MKRFFAIALAIFLMVIMTVPTQAGYFDFALFGSLHSVDVSVDIENIDFVVPIRSQGNRAVVLLDSKGDMTSIDDFELEEAKRSYSEIGIGYKLGPITPFVGYGTRGISITERTVAINEITGKNEVVTKNTKDTDSGVVFGVSFDARIESMGLMATVAKAVDGLYGEVKAKYYVNDHLALLVGGIYHPGVSATGFVLGLGIAY